MITENQIEKIVEKLIDRVEQANTVFLKSIGSSIKSLKKIKPTEAQQLIQILKYGGKYEDIIKKIAKYVDLDIKDIDEIFKEYAKKDQMFYKQFYDYRNKPFIPFEENQLLQRQTQALSNMVKNEMYNFTRNNVLGYTINGKFYNLKETYNQLLDTAFLNVGQGKETFDSAMTNIIKQIGGSGLKTLNYESGRNIRLDSAIRMHLKGRLRELHNENQKIIGEEIDADGYEISVHQNPAIDHEKVQGRQFSIEEYEKLNNGLEAKDYKGNTYTLDHDGKNGYRPISEMNCYHYIFSIVLGVNNPEYTDKQLKEIINNNEKGFEFEGKHYTNYEGTQMQRNIERAIREQKDIQILAKESGNEELVSQSQEKIRILTRKYNELSKESGLPTKANRLKVSGYQRTNINKIKEINFNKPLNTMEKIAKYVNSRKDKLYGLDEKGNQLKLNEEYGFNDKPTLIDKKEFDDLDDNFNYNEPEEMKENQYVKLYRGWGNRQYYDDYINIDSKNFKYGEGGYADGVGTYATDNEWTASQYSKEKEDLLMEIAIPNDAKFISKDKLAELHYNIYDDFDKNRNYYIKKYGNKVVDILDTMNNNISSTAVLNGYEIIYNNQWQNWVILNRKIVKIKNR